jgi:hypothetical protein
MHSLLPSAISVLLVAYLLSLPALSLQQQTDPPTNTGPDTTTAAPTTTTPKPLTYEACKEWFTALNGAWRIEKGDNCTMETGKNVELYVDLVHPYKSKENIKFMEYLNTLTIATIEQLNDYWKEDDKPPVTHCDATKGLLCIGKEKIKFCRDCSDDEVLKKNKEVCANITGIIQPKSSGRDPRVPREAKGK